MIIDTTILFNCLKYTKRCFIEKLKETRSIDEVKREEKLKREFEDNTVNRRVRTIKRNLGDSQRNYQEKIKYISFNTLEPNKFLEFLDLMQEIKNKDIELLRQQTNSGHTPRNRSLSDEDIYLIAWSLMRDYILATDDKRIRKIIQKNYGDIRLYSSSSILKQFGKTDDFLIVRTSQ